MVNLNINKMKPTIVFMAVLLCGANAYATHTGRVFIDKNANGIFDKGEKGLGHVAVSDGLHVVFTKADGSFSLPGHEKERFVFITTPSDYKTNNAYYQRIEKGKSSYDFGLQPDPVRVAKDGTHRFVQINE